MWPFNPSREGSSVLDQQSQELTAAYLCRLQAENNSLLRELIRALTGQPATTGTVSLSRPASRIRTDKDVFVVTRTMVEAQDRRRQEAEIAPHRIPANGRASSEPSIQEQSGQPVTAQAFAPPNTTSPTQNLF